MLARRRLCGGMIFYPWPIHYSCRFDSARMNELDRTFVAPTSRYVWTLSAWLKNLCPADDNVYHGIFSAFVGNRGVSGLGDMLSLHNGKLVFGWVADTAASTALYRDGTSHGHLLVASNGTNIQAFWNNALLWTYIGRAEYFNSTLPHAIGANYSSPSLAYSGYISDFYFVDGLALAPSDFGQPAPLVPNVWVPKKATISNYGNNGFHLEFRNASDLGTDTSGLGHNWTNYYGLTSADQSEDTPTNNCAVLAPLNGSGALSNGNLTMAAGDRRATFYVSAGRFGWKYTLAAAGNLGVINTSGAKTAVTGALGDVIELELDFSAATLKKRVNGGALTSVATGLIGPLAPYFEAAGTAQFIYTPTDTSLSTLCTNSLPISTPDITTSGSFTGNASADGPVIYTGGVPETLTINGNAVIWGTHADKLASGFKVRTASASYNSSGTNTWTATAPSNMRYPRSNAQTNP